MRRKSLIIGALAVVGCSNRPERSTFDEPSSAGSIAISSAHAGPSTTTPLPKSPTTSTSTPDRLAPPTDGALVCERLPFADDIPIAEASGAVWLPAAGGIVVVVADSGNGGDYLVLDDDDGRVLAAGKVPLGGPGDDLEGLATDGTLLWAITSSGHLRAWSGLDGATPAADLGKPLALAIPAYPLDAAEPCKLTQVNCGLNFEGLCLVAPHATGTRPPQRCDGYAASKATGKLLCLVRDGDRYRLDPSRSIVAAAPEALAACEIASDGAVWTGENLFGSNRVQRFAAGIDRAPLGTGFAETMALAPAPNGDTIVFRFSDLGRSPSRASRYRCRGATAAAAPQ